MDARVRRKILIELEISERDAEVLAADLVFLLEHTKNLPGVVRLEEAPFVIESQERISVFVALLSESLKGIRSGTQ